MAVPRTLEPRGNQGSDGATSTRPTALAPTLQGRSWDDPQRHELGSVKMLCYGPDDVFRRAAIIVYVLIGCGARDRADRLLAPIDVARRELSYVSLSGDLQLLERELDGRVG